MCIGSFYYLLASSHLGVVKNMWIILYLPPFQVLKMIHSFCSLPSLPPITQELSKVFPRKLEIYLPLDYILVMEKQKTNKCIL